MKAAACVIACLNNTSEPEYVLHIGNDQVIEHHVIRTCRVQILIFKL